MRKLIIVFLAVSLFAACNNDKKGPAMDKKTDTKEEKTSDVKEADDKEKPKDEERTASSDWTSKDVRDFVDNCIAEAVKNGLQEQKASDYCNCMQRKLEDMYPQKAEVANLDLESPRIKSMIEKCLE